MTERISGRVVTMKYDRGFFFIRTDSGISYFAHASDLPHGAFEMLNTGDQVQFEELLPTPAQGRRARNVVVTAEAVGI
jgi:cold shock CspA family protein